MFGPWFSYLTALKVIFFFLLIYYYLPSSLVAFKKDDDVFDRFFISFIHMVSVTIVLVHLLAFLHLYDYLSLVGSYAGAIVLLAWWRGQSPAQFAEGLGVKFIVTILDTVEGAGGLAPAVRGYIESRRRALVSILGSWLRGLANPTRGLLPLGVLVYSAYLRFNHSLTHAYLGASDSYVHLAWTKYLDSNQIYKDGIYPYGYHAVLSALGKLTFLDPLLILRFVGPLGGLLMVLSVYYVSRKLCRGLEVAAVLGTFVFGMGIGLPSDIWRQISPLPQEFAAIFLLPGFYFAMRYTEKRERRDLALFAECLGITVAVHPYVSVYLMIGVALLLAIRVIGRLPAWQTAVDLILWGLGGSVIGLLPLGVGMALGMKFHGSLGYVARMVRSAAPSWARTLPIWKRLLLGNIFLNATIVFSSLLILHAIYLLVFRRGKPSEAISRMSLPLFSLAMYSMYNAGAFGLPPLMDISRTGIFFALVASAVYGMAAYRLFMIPGSRLLPVPGRAYLASGILILTMLSLGFRYPTRPPTGVQLEYNAAVNNYLKIAASFPSLDWTIVSPVQQYSETLNRGWHYESWEFVRDFGINAARNPSFDLPIPTTYIFIFTERIPLFTDKPVDLRLAQSSLPPPGDNPDETYYINRENRAIIQAKIITWVREYLKSHNNMSVYYKDREMIVYMIKHAPKSKGG